MARAQACLTAIEAVPAFAITNKDADGTLLGSELAQLTIVPKPCVALSQQGKGNSNISPFSMPEPQLVQQLKERPMQPALSLLVPVPTNLSATAKSGLMFTTSGVLPSSGCTIPYSGALSQPANTLVPPHGVKAVCGKRAKMEDTFNVQTNFVNVQLSSADSDFCNKLPARIASQVGDQLEQQVPNSLPLSPDSCSGVPSLSASDASVGGSSIVSDSSGCCDMLHFFGVYDGHGGVEAAQHCANRLHYHLSTALTRLAGLSTALHVDTFCTMVDRSGIQCQAEWSLCQHQQTHCTAQNSRDPSTDPLTHGSAAVHRMFSIAARADNHASSLQTDSEATHVDGGLAHPASLESSTTDSDSSTSEPSRSDGTTSMSDMLEAALRNAFIKTDEEFAEDGSSAMVGSTAVVALVGSKKIWIANCGDSRAVLCRSSKAIQVTDDHKPEREDEAERVEKAGGQVLFWNGHRVMGVLAMSRAIGDHGLRPYVIPEPEITVLSRVADDDFLLLASDGLWDVMSNQEAITLAMRCLTRSVDKGTSRKAAVRVAATVLTRAAVDRGSKDNVTVVIIDLKAPQPGSSDCKAESLPTPCDMLSSLPSPGAASCVYPCPSTPMPVGVPGQRRTVSHNAMLSDRALAISEAQNELCDCPGQ